MDCGICGLAAARTRGMTRSAHGVRAAFADLVAPFETRRVGAAAQGAYFMAGDAVRGRALIVTTGATVDVATC